MVRLDVGREWVQHWRLRSFNCVYDVTIETG